MERERERERREASFFYNIHLSNTVCLSFSPSVACLPVPVENKKDDSFAVIIFSLRGMICEMQILCNPLFPPVVWKCRKDVR